METIIKRESENGVENQEKEKVKNDFEKAVKKIVTDFNSLKKNIKKEGFIEEEEDKRKQLYKQLSERFENELVILFREIGGEEANTILLDVCNEYKTLKMEEDNFFRRVLIKATTKKN